MVNPKLHSVTACAVICRDDGRILVLRRADHEKVYPGAWACPGGKVEGNDTITETVIREAQEECGLDLESGMILIKEKAILRADRQTSKALSFLCTAKNPESVRIDTNDFTDFKWVTLEELRQLPHVGLEPEFAKAEAILKSGANLSPFYTDTDKVVL